MFNHLMHDNHKRKAIEAKFEDNPNFLDLKGPKLAELARRCVRMMMIER